MEIIHLADIGDIYNIFTGHDMNEFIVRRRQGSTTYFFSSMRDPIVKVGLSGFLQDMSNPLYLGHPLHERQTKGYADEYVGTVLSIL